MKANSRWLWCKTTIDLAWEINCISCHNDENVQAMVHLISGRTRSSPSVMMLECFIFMIHFSLHVDYILFYKQFSACGERRWPVIFLALVALSLKMLMACKVRLGDMTVYRAQSMPWITQNGREDIFPEAGTLGIYVHLFNHLVVSQS